jgi:hypothetical protein
MMRLKEHVYGRLVAARVNACIMAAFKRLIEPQAWILLEICVLVI